MITRKLVNWCDKTFKDACCEPNNRKANVKAFASGAVEGFADAAIVMYIPVVIALYILQKKSVNK